MRRSIYLVALKENCGILIAVENGAIRDHMTNTRAWCKIVLDEIKAFPEKQGFFNWRAYDDKSKLCGQLFSEVFRNDRMKNAILDVYEYEFHHVQRNIIY